MPSAARALSRLAGQGCRRSRAMRLSFQSHEGGACSPDHRLLLPTALSYTIVTFRSATYPLGSMPSRRRF